MNSLLSFAAPLALVLPGLAVESVRELPMSALDASFGGIGEGPRIPAAKQVRIEEHVIIRISPRAPIRPDFVDPFEDSASRLVERKMGKCVPVGAIAGVRLDGNDRLILFMRDRRIISATLEKSCRARDFYSGFYVAPSKDGMLCAERDQLQSRAGANCQVSKFRQLVEEGD